MPRDGLPKSLMPFRNSKQHTELQHMSEASNPEIGKSISLENCNINYLEAGDPANPTVFLIHGSGPGVTAYANWKLIIPRLSEKFHVIAPDMVGFGYSTCTPAFKFELLVWVDSLCQFMDKLSVESAYFVGNSYGGAVSLALTARHPERVKRLVMMGSAGIHFDISEGLRRVWGYTPSVQAMSDLMGTFAYNKHLVTDQIVQSRYEASMRPGVQESYAAMFPEPMQEKLDALCLPEDEIKKIETPVLLVHGREDSIVPLDNALKAHHLLKYSQLHVFGECGHWTQVEKKDEFTTLVENFCS
jgi:2-hydroxymuconate-semialdehyde hydrolase